jgi:magnesium chelatase family protein
MSRSVLVHSAVPVGVGARPLAVRVDVRNSVRSVNRRNDDAIVRQALRSHGVPDVPFTVRIVPDTPRSSSSIDLAIALGLLAARDVIPSAVLADVHVLGRLTMDGSIQPVRGVLPILTVLASLMEATDDRAIAVLVPRANLHEAQLVDGIVLLPADSLSEAIAQLRQPTRPAPTRAASIAIPDAPRDPHFDALDTPPYVRAALDIAAAGDHHLLLMGPHGSHTTWLARRLHALLPPPTPREALTITAHASAAGLLPPTALITHRPFRAPHHTASVNGICGCGPVDVRPGELALAHHGVLLLDQLHEFTRHTLDTIAYHLLRREVTTQRRGDTITMPASTLLVATMTPCPCGRRGHPEVRCTCTPEQVFRHYARLSTRCLRLFDLVVPVTPRTAFTDSAPHREDITARLGRINRARTRRTRRAPDHNAVAQLTPTAAALLRTALTAETLRPDDETRVVDTALTIADLADSDHIEEANIEQALAYRLPAHKSAHLEPPA